MRESIGTSFILNFIVVFIVFIFAFLAATLSYYKAYKVNNAIVHAIEKYEGYNAYSAAEIKIKLKNYGYQTDNITCPKLNLGDVDPNWSCLRNSFDARANAANTNCTNTKIDYKVKEGYCVYSYFNENAPVAKSGGKATTDIYYSYGVISYMRLQLPVIGKLLKIKVFSKTYSMYYFSGQK